MRNITLPDWLYNLLNSAGIYYVIGIWLLICIAWKSRRETFIARLVDLVSKRIIFEKDDQPKSIPLYPRSFLERVAVEFQKAMVMPLDGIIKGAKGWLSGLIKLIYTRDRPWRTFGYVLFLVLMLVFVLSDAIAIANALDVAGWIPYALPAILQRYEIAAAMGSLFAIITGVFVFSEINRETSIFTDWDRTEGLWKKLARSMAVFLIIFGFLVVIFFGIRRFDALGYISSISSTTNTLVDVVILIIVPLNTVVATALIAEEGFKGFLMIVIALLAILIGLLYVLNYLANLLGYVLPFALDVIWRIVLFAVFIIAYVVVTPIDWVIWVLGYPFRMWGAPAEIPKDKSSKDKKGPD
jgi:hypothetical protein